MKYQLVCLDIDGTLVTDEKARKAMGEAAHQKVMEHYLTVNTGKDAMEELLCSESYTK